MESDREGEAIGYGGYGSSSELSTPHRVRREEYDSRVEYSSSSSSTPPGKRELDAARFEVGMATRNERDLPAYVRVVTGTGRGGGGGDNISWALDAREYFGGEEESRFGKDGVRSKCSKSALLVLA